jgi:hypothetical protein
MQMQILIYSYIKDRLRCWKKSLTTNLWLGDGTSVRLAGQGDAAFLRTHPVTSPLRCVGT